MLVLGIDVLIAVLFATSLHFIMGPGGMHSFGHAAYFGLGAYGAALLVKWLAAPMGVALVAAPLARRSRRAAVRLVRGAAVRRLSRDADARVRADRLVDRVPVGRVHRRLERRARHLAGAAVRPAWRVLSADARCSPSPACCCCGACCLRRSAMRCAPAAIRRCARRRSASTSSACTGSHSPSPARVCGVAGGMFAFAKGSISPETISIGRSIDGLVMVLLGGMQTLRVRSSALGVRRAAGTVMQQTEYWRALLGGIILAVGAGVSRAASPARSRRLPRRRGALMSELAVALAAQEVRRRARRRRRVSFAVARGEFLALIGPNGAGKSTCFNIINGQLAPDAGDDPLRRPRHRRACRRAKSGAAASAAPSRSPPPSAR